MAKRDNEIWWWIGGAAALLGGTYFALRPKKAEVKKKPPKEIPSNLISSAQPPFLGLGAEPLLGTNRGTFHPEDRSWPDPKILAMKAGDTARLQLRDTEVGNALSPSKASRQDKTWLKAWTAPWGTFTLDTASDVVMPDADFVNARPIGTQVGLYNVGGPSASKIERTPQMRSADFGKFKKSWPGNLDLKTKPSWGPGDWAQIRLYPAWVYHHRTQGRNVVDAVEYILDDGPVFSVWIMGA